VQGVALTTRPRPKEDHDGQGSCEGLSDQLGGKVKEGAGDLTGDKKLKSEGVVDQVKGKVQNAVGGIKDAIKGK
jgi:uncharacterized protein YjbJ (UPF0337 family)